MSNSLAPEHYAIDYEIDDGHDRVLPDHHEHVTFDGTYAEWKVRVRSYERVDINSPTDIRVGDVRLQSDDNTKVEGWIQLFTCTPVSLPTGSRYDTHVSSQVLEPTREYRHECMHWGGPSIIYRPYVIDEAEDLLHLTGVSS
jgi:hypothetical protein